MTISTILLGISIILDVLYLTVISRFCQSKAMDLFGVHGAHVLRLFCFILIIGFNWISLMVWFDSVIGR